MIIQKNQRSYFIEGGDNVGKTTLIQYIKKELHRDNTHLYFNKYPKSKRTDFMNTINYALNYIAKTNITNSESFKAYEGLNNLLINTMIKDMSKSIRENLFADFDEEFIDISDRGPLSTFLYNNTINESSIISTVGNFSIFLENYFFPIYSNTDIKDLNIIILNNNKPDILIESSKKEDIDYKKSLDEDTILQERVNRLLNDIVYEIDNNVENLNLITHPFKFFYINIYTDDGKRKTTEEVYKEFLSIVFKNEEENNNE